MIGFGSIGQGTLPLIERHFDYDKSRFVVIDPQEKHKELLDERGIRFIQTGLTQENYREVLTPLLTAGGGQGFCVNVSVDTSSVDIMELCRSLGCFYIDTVNEPWAGFYFDKSKGPEARTNYALREITMEARRRNPGGTTAVVLLRRQFRAWVSLVRQAGALNIAKDSGIELEEPKSR
jgi:homospermidine synthase